MTTYRLHSIRSLQNLTLAVVLIAVATTAWAKCPIPAEEFTPDPEFTSEFLQKRCDFKDTGVNPYFILKPGYRIVLESEEELVKVTVLNQTRWVGGIKTRVLEEYEYEKDGDELIPVERSLNFVALCSPTNSIHYFGEDVFFFDEDGNPIPGTGGWHAGENGARAGILMPGTILVGGGYYQEIAPEDSALDKGRIVALEKGCEAGEFEFDKRLCVTIADTTDCEHGSGDEKRYVAGVGIVQDEDLEVTSYGFIDDE